MVRVIETAGLGVDRGVWDQGADGIPSSAFEPYEGNYGTNLYDWAESTTTIHSGKKARTTSSKRKLVELEPVVYPQAPAIDLNKLKPKK